MTSKIRDRALAYLIQAPEIAANLQHWNGALVAHQQQISVARKTQQCYV
jgi:hypothetical protein